MGVFDLQRIEGPFHQVEAPGEGIVALGELQTTAQTRVAVLRQHRQHVRVQIGLAVAVAGERHGETDHRVAVEGPDHLAADALGHNKDAPGNEIAVAVAPDLELQDNAALEVLQGGEMADLDAGVVVADGRS